MPWPQIACGYEYERGRYVVLTDKDFARVRVEATHTFAVRDFVPRGSIGPRERLAALLPTGPALALVMLRLAGEIRAPQSLDLPPARRAWDPRR